MGLLDSIINLAVLPIGTFIFIIGCVMMRITIDFYRAGSNFDWGGRNKVSLEGKSDKKGKSEWVVVRKIGKNDLF